MRFLVVYNGPEDPNGGSSGTVWQTNAALRNLGHHVDTLFENDITRVIAHHNLHYALELSYRILQATRAKAAGSHYDAILISQPYGYLVGQWLRKQGLDTVYIHRSHGHELAAKYQLDLWGGALIGDARPRWRRLASDLLSRRLCQQARLSLMFADGTIVPSSFDREFLVNREKVDPLRVRTIFHAPAPAYLESPVMPYTCERHKRMLYIGNFTKIKGGEILWKVGTALLRRFSELTLTIVTPRTDHDRAISGFGEDVRSRIALREWVTQETLMDIFDHHGLQVIPSLYEGASKAHYEGMSRGLCVVSSAVGAMRDSTESGKTGWLVPAGNYEEFIGVLSHLIVEFELAQSIAADARKLALGFTWVRTASEIVSFVEQLRHLKSGEVK